jgi:hypothetical protein
MAAGNVIRNIRAPGRVVIGPTQSFDTGTYPYGGTEVGKTTLAVLTNNGTPMLVPYESLGEIGAVLEPNRDITFSFFLRGWDDDAVEQLMAQGYIVGTQSQHAMYAEPGNTPGADAQARAVVLAYIPDDTIHVPGLLIYRGIPNFPSGLEISFQRGVELGVRVDVTCLRNGSDHIYRVGRIHDLQLSP